MKIIEDINIINSLMTTIIEHQNEQISATPGTMNIVEIMNHDHLENQHSNVISFLINPKEKHHHKEYGTKLLDMLENKGLSFSNNEIQAVYREFPTDKHRRIDILIETKSDYIILENKVYADDLDNQINDYISFFEENYQNNVKPYLIYLTIDGKPPIEKSISENKLKLMQKENRCIFLSYTSILEWLQKLETKLYETELKSALIQYIDVLNGLTGTRKEIYNMEQEIISELLIEYKKKSSARENRKKLSEILMNVHAWQENIKTVVYLNFFEDVYEQLFMKNKNNVKLICKGKTYSDISEWEKNVIKDSAKYGIKYHYKNNSYEFTKSLILKDSKSEELIYEVSDIKLGNINEIYKYKLKNQKDIITNNQGFKQKIDKWFSNALFMREIWHGNGNESLAEHVSKDWFLNC